MAKLGGFGKFSFKLGGEPSNEWKAYNALKRAVGEGGSPPDDPDGELTLDGAWRRARGNALGALLSVVESAVYQGFPNTVTDELRSYEEIVGSYLPADASDEERRIEVTRRWVFDNASNYPAFAEALADLDTRFTVLAPDRTNARITYEGKVFDSPGNGDFDQYRDHSKFPNYSDDFFVTALLDVGEGVVPVGAVGLVKTKAEAVLGNALPAWNDYAVLLDVGFTLDMSLLDVTGFSP